MSSDKLHKKMAEPMTLVLAIMIICTAVCESNATIYYNDGGVHEISSIISESVLVENSPADYPTTVNLVSGGVIEEDLFVWESSKVFVHDGLIERGMFAGGESQVVISGGSIFSDLWVSENSQVSMFGGTVESSVYVCADSQFSMSGGTIKYLQSENGNAIVSGGTISDIWATGYAQVSISGGQIKDALIAYNNSAVTIYGTDFNFEYGLITSRNGRLTGVLESGEPIDVGFEVLENATIILVPEPATILLLSLGGLLLGRRKR